MRVFLLAAVAIVAGCVASASTPPEFVEIYPAPDPISTPDAACHCDKDCRCVGDTHCGASGCHPTVTVAVAAPPAAYTAPSNCINGTCRTATPAARLSGVSAGSPQAARTSAGCSSGRCSSSYRPTRRRGIFGLGIF